MLSSISCLAVVKPGLARRACTAVATAAPCRSSLLGQIALTAAPPPSAAVGGAQTAAAARFLHLSVAPATSTPTLSLGLRSAVATVFGKSALPSLLSPISPPLLGSMCVRGIKTNRAAAKRIRVKGSGALKRMRAGLQHNTGYKSKKRKNRLALGTGIKGKGHERRMRRLIGAL